MHSHSLSPLCSSRLAVYLSVYSQQNLSYFTDNRGFWIMTAMVETTWAYELKERYLYSFFTLQSMQVKYLFRYSENILLTRIKQLAASVLYWPSMKIYAVGKLDQIESTPPRIECTHHLSPRPFLLLQQFYIWKEILFPFIKCSGAVLNC